MMDRTQVARRIDHTNVRPEATEKDILALCQEATGYGFYAVSVNPCRIRVAVEALRGTGIHVGSTVGFSTGATTTRLKVIEAEQALSEGSTELDMVMNIGWLKEGNLKLVEEDIRAVGTAAGKDIILKVIIETALLSDGEKTDAAKMVVQAGAHFVKTSTGFYPGRGATVEDVKLLKAVVGNSAKVKAAGGIRDAETAIRMIEAGADRIGTSTGVAIVTAISNSK